MDVDAAPHDPAAVGTPTGDAMLQALRAVPRILRSPSAQQALLENPTTEAHRLGLPAEAGPLLLNIVNAGQRPKTSDEKGGSTERTRDLLMEPFGHITWSFRILTAMSVLMFAVGLAFLVVALMRAINEGDVSTSTLAIAGVGLADFVLIFYRRPWEDIGRGLSNSQQARIVATSYLSGISMLRATDSDVHATLHTLTREAVQLLEEFTESPRRTGST
jgi:hypothetical protein